MADIPFLQAVSVSKIYPGATQSGVKDISIEIVPGKITAIIGESGSGKSTLLRMLFGLLSPNEGTVYFKGERIWGPEEKLIPGHDEMKMVTQHTDDLNLFARVWDNVAAMLPSTNVKLKEEKTEAVLTQLNMMQMAYKRVADLSGGEKQRVAIARAIITRPHVLFLDEPFNQVDTSFREGLQHDIRQIVRESGITVVMVSHDPAEVLSMADELVVIRDGVIVEKGHPKQLYQNPKQLYTAELLSNCNVLTPAEAKLCGIATQKESVVVYPEWIRLTTSPEATQWTVREVLFKGFYEDLLLEYNEVVVRVVNGENDRFKPGDSIGIKVRKWLEY
ncbi:ABC transporter ATP-binding protein [Mucilaginibacter psychrotolerans]|uniref:ABC transporter ATP-binding protein n=1 Tax=Mucilaginibacter psychrotolerans TaxID=1524096 RepID=A0A4Y8SFQ1_9SPHI|nr:ABC transporter ATP-binding protein [Mucilaginibacter psychrotolerans]TFF37475.1 ABC transporter ATP-binding protein [Mucilaginibacter psychrotolerans]